MEFIKNYTFNNIYKLLLGKKVNFVSDCEIFPNFNIILKIYKIYIKDSEIIFEGLTDSNKKIIVGSNMKNLQFKIV